MKAKRMPLRLRRWPPVLVALLPSLAAAQAGPDLNALVIDWAQGRYASPVMCQIGAETVRGIRRILLTADSSDGRGPLLAVQFVDMQVEDASRCFNSTGEEQPNLLGKVQLRLPGRPHPETAMRDFKLAIRRHKGFDLEIVGGVLKVQPVSLPPSAPRTIDFRGGRAGLHMVLPATDAARELADFPSPRKAVLALEAKSGMRLVFPIFLASAR